jgi:DNA polymerase III delta prime subunit
MNKTDFLWVEKYRPKSIDKTTVAKALCEQLGVDYYVINGSDEGRFLDTVRNQAKNFASTVSLSASDAKHKVIIIDEADNTTHDVQLLLRANIETFYNNCRFIFTCAEGVEYDNKVLVELINKHFPDWRRVLNELQRYSVSGKIDSAILAQFSDVSVEELIKNLKDKDFGYVRKWVSSNLDNDPNLILRRVYDGLVDSVDGPSLAAAVLIIAKYQYQIAFVADQEINVLAALTEIMVECKTLNENLQ